MTGRIENSEVGAQQHVAHPVNTMQAGTSAAVESANSLATSLLQPLDAEVGEHICGTLGANALEIVNVNSCANVRTHVVSVFNPADFKAEVEQALKQFPNLSSLWVQFRNQKLERIPGSAILSNAYLDDKPDNRVSGWEGDLPYSEHLTHLDVHHFAINEPGKFLSSVAKAFPNLDTLDMSNRNPKTQNGPNPYEPLTADQLTEVAGKMPKLRSLTLRFSLRDMNPSNMLNALKPALQHMDELDITVWSALLTSLDLSAPNVFDQDPHWLVDVFTELSNHARNLVSIAISGGHLLRSSYCQTLPKVSEEAVVLFLQERPPIKKLDLGGYEMMSEQAQNMILAQMQKGVSGSSHQRAQLTYDGKGRRFETDPWISALRKPPGRGVAPLAHECD